MPRISCEAIASSGVIYGPMEHYEVSAAVDCRCRLCLDCFSAREELSKLIAQSAHTPCSCEPCSKQVSGRLSSHSRGCKCDLCGQIEAAMIKFLGTQNRRDIWSELSYHANRNPELGESLMQWLAREMERPRPSWAPDFYGNKRNQDSWWGAPKSMSHTIGDWLGHFARQAVLAVSGTHNTLPLEMTDSL